jgi:hypothetical protein
MRKYLFAALILGLAASIAAPSGAAKGGGRPVKFTFSGSSADAFWYTDERIDDTHVRESVWYVGVFQSPDGTSSDVYRDVAVCTEGGIKGEECTIESSMYGFTDLVPGEFKYDAKRLSSAHLNATYLMQAYDTDGNTSGDPFPLQVTTDWSAAGQVVKSKGTSVYRSGCETFHDNFRGSFRAQDATGHLDGGAQVPSQDLGSTDDATLGTNSDRSSQRTC